MRKHAGRSPGRAHGHSGAGLSPSPRIRIPAAGPVPGLRASTRVHDPAWISAARLCDGSADSRAVLPAGACPRACARTRPRSGACAGADRTSCSRSDRLDGGPGPPRASLPERCIVRNAPLQHAVRKVRVPVPERCRLLDEQLRDGSLRPRRSLRLLDRASSTGATRGAAPRGVTSTALRECGNGLRDLRSDDGGPSFAPRSADEAEESNRRLRRDRHGM
jgi:hypothetical protein